jgi:hypothetical protein
MKIISLIIIKSKHFRNNTISLEKKIIPGELKASPKLISLV